MARIRMNESVSGWYMYEMDLTPEYCNSLNEYLSGIIDNFIPLSIEDVIDLCVYNKNNKRCMENVLVKYFDRYNNKPSKYPNYLRNEVIDYVKQDCFCNRVNDFEYYDSGDLYFERIKEV